MGISIIEDKFAISELLTRYATSIDKGDYDEFITCFTEDAVIYHGSGHVYHGHDEILGHAQDFGERRAMLPNVRHFNTDIVSKIDGDQATSVCHVLVTISDESGPKLEYAGEYRDKLIKRNGNWAIYERHYINDAPLRVYQDNGPHGTLSAKKIEST